MRNQRDYWEKQIIDWENVSYCNLPVKKVPLIEKLAQPFRGPVRHRKILAYGIINSLKPNRVLELGCGTGRFAISLVTTANIGHVTGVDISGEAIKHAQDCATAMNLTNKLTFISSSIANLDFKALGPFDYVVGLGLTPYLTDEEFAHLFTSIKEIPFFFDVHPKGFSFQNLIHAFYRSIKGHPFYIQYSKKEIQGKLARLGVLNVVWKESKAVYYIQPK